MFTTLALLYLVVVTLLTSRLEGKRTSAELADAARLLGFVDARLRTLDVPGVYCLPQEHDRAFEVLRDAIHTDEVAQLLVTGATMTEDEAIARAQSLE